ncbi:hypothetical protein [Cellulomonas carbonis]|uniref:Uncharacterized protein n=1 Tax=Cellulomonas carbonis T26 TaxID=947969 RepID=A0A0A0BQ72_9CELL|nr:hypothetical protein [Cellulomonas carbonis]KGM10633.1 hypothetical protein N868_14400 [Cellulomonas carbonis T26]GGC07262.1 hypothetical protein GCM10010972_20700 [Cellulomonas carbonis]
MTHGPTDWVSGERVFGPPGGTLDVDWLVPAVLEGVPTATPDQARAALAAAWDAAQGGPAPQASEVQRRADAVVREAVEGYRP